MEQHEILKICQDRNEHLLIADFRVSHGTYVGSDSLFHCDLTSDL